MARRGRPWIAGAAIRLRVPARPGPGLLALLLPLSLVLSANRALAHEPAHGRQLVWAPAGSGASASGTGGQALPRVVVSNRGLVFADGEGAGEGEGDARFSLRCNESFDVPSSELPSVRFSDAQTLTLGVFHGVYQSSDRACSLAPATGLPDISLSGLGDAGDTLLTATRTASDSAAVWSSDDGGSSWSSLYTNAGGEYFEALLPAPSAPATVYAAGVRGGDSLCGVSQDTGVSWTVHVLEAGVVPFAVHPGKRKVLFAYQLADAVRGTYRILRSADGCAGFTSVLEDASLPSALAGDDSAIWLGLGGVGGLYRSRDEGKSFVRVLKRKINSVTCLATRENRLWLCANMAPNANGVWYSDDGGETLEEFMTFADVSQPVDCVDAAARAACAGPWYDFTSEIPLTDLAAGVPDGGDTDADAGAMDAGAVDAGAAELADADAAAAPDTGMDPDATTGSSSCQAAPGQRTPSFLLVLLLGLAASGARRRGWRRNA